MDPAPRLCLWPNVSLMPQNIYDDPTFFKAYSGFRRSREGLEGSPEWPTLRGMLPALRGKRVLDLGCGFGAFTRWAAGEGATVYGLDLSVLMLAEARARTSWQAVTYLKASIDAPPYRDKAFDVVFSSLALHYLPDFAAVCHSVRRVSISGGWFIFSVEHPIYTAPSQPGWHTLPGGATTWALNEYLNEGLRKTDWLVEGVEKYHRTVGTYIEGLIDHGFRLARLVEWGPTPEQIADNPEWAVEIHRPPFLLIAAQAAR